MDTTQDIGLSLVIGSFLPLVISVAIQSKWNSKNKSLVAFGLCLIASILTSFISKEVRLSDPSFDWIAWFGVIYGTSFATYVKIWKPTNIAEKIQKKTDV